MEGSPNRHWRRRLLVGVLGPLPSDEPQGKAGLSLSEVSDKLEILSGEAPSTSSHPTIDLTDV